MSKIKQLSEWSTIVPLKTFSRHQVPLADKDKPSVEGFGFSLTVPEDPATGLLLQRRSNQDLTESLVRDSLKVRLKEIL
jgi:hypothetical protein